MRSLLRSLSPALALLACYATAQTSKTYAITGARIELGDGRVIDKGTIVIKDGKIAEVGPNVSAPSDAEQINGAGMTVYPGFIDGYTTRGLKSFKATNNVGTQPDTRTTAPPNMWPGNRKGIRAESIASQNLDIAGEIKDNLAQGVTAAMLGPGTGVIRGTCALVMYRDGKPEEILLNPIAGEDLSFRGPGGFGGGGGPNGAPSTDYPYPGTVLGYTALIRQTFLDAQRYAQLNASSQKPQKDDTYEALQGLLQGKMPAVFAVDQDREITRAIHLAEEFNLRPVINGGREAWRQADTLKAKNVGLILAMEIGNDPGKSTFAASEGAPPEVLAERTERWKANATCAKKLADAGVIYAFSNAGNSAGEYLGSVRKLISVGGLSHEAALKAMTSNAAKIFGVSDKVGTIEAGKIANLTIMNGDFANDSTKVQSVFVGGVMTDLSKPAKGGN